MENPLIVWLNRTAMFRKKGAVMDVIPQESIDMQKSNLWQNPLEPTLGHSGDYPIRSRYSPII
jgi:hypothetical protein